MKDSIPLQTGETLPKAPPNDPQRQGNIWHRYEQLENMTKSLAGVKQQMVMEKAKHQRVRPPLDLFPEYPISANPNPILQIAFSIKIGIKGENGEDSGDKIGRCRSATGMKLCMLSSVKTAGHLKPSCGALLPTFKKAD